MPVSFPVATHTAKPYPFSQGQLEAGYNAIETLTLACPDQYSKAGEILQFSLGKESGGDESGRNLEAKVKNVVPNQNGFVATLLDAYTQDRALIIRPDDVWLAILFQFSFFVNARAELLRANFVAHQGKRELVVVVAQEGANRYTVDFGDIARQMAGLVEKNVVDESLRAWATPDFTTTTDNDTTVSAVLLMATMKQYFDYTIRLMGCGIPRVTLEGERSDWVKILERLEKLKEYGLETTAWYHLLLPVITRFVAAFDTPDSAENIDFWQRVAHYTPGGSGRGDHYSGWISAFTVFNKQGRWMGNHLNEAAASKLNIESLNSQQFWKLHERQYMEKDLILDGTPYHLLRRKGIPPGHAEVDVLLIDNGKRFDCAMVAGNIAMSVTSSNDPLISPGGINDTVRPLAGWWLFIKDETDMQAKAKAAYRQKEGRF
ncbi:hypothetical protein R3P38DRAFT_2759278 [Favolaschia claudopus]|uniref:DUF4419 domain-containing protein n=1 Tax=Favolaschia claudopus TaxID=2862362 RepID=A0AAW0E6X4_9AGAR